MRLRVMTRADIPAGMRLKDIAGWNQTEADWQRFLDASPDGCFVAESADRSGLVCGTVTTIIYEDRVAWIGMVLVDPQHRGQGIGTQLLTRAIEYLKSRQVPAIKLDATPQGRLVYERLGFVAEYEIERRVLQRGTKADVGPSTAADGESETAIAEIIKTDREVFGADRGVLLRSVHNESPGLTICDTRDGIVGYCLGRRGSQADHLGPWVARSEGAARGLLEEFLRRSDRDTIFVDCVKANPLATVLLESFDFRPARPLTRMYFGTNAYPGRLEASCAILGPEFG